MTAANSPSLTKRARRKLGANPSQAWPQMPHVKTAAGRSNAYLRVAGLTTTIKSPPLDPKLDILNSPEIKFGRLLGSPEQRVRHEAVRRLSQYLTQRSVIDKDGVGISELDLLKLWKGLWHTLYMADRVPVQDELSKQLAKLIWCVAGSEEEDEYAGKTYLDMYDDAVAEEEEANVGDEDEEDEEYTDDCVTIDEISNTTGKVFDNDDDDDDEEQENSEENDEEEAEENDSEDDDTSDDSTPDNRIPHCRGAHLAALFVKTFFQTLRREWGSMDKYRVDKFYTLIRLMMGQVYEYMAKRHWNLGIIRLFNDTIYEEILSQTPNGLRLHLIDLTLPELAQVNATIAPMPLTEATFLDAMEPYLALAQMCGDKYVQKRVVEKILMGFLENYSVVANVGDDDSLVMDEVHVGTVSDFIFQLASDGVTKDEYRESLYDAYKDYKRRLKQVGKDVALGQDDDEDEEFGAEDEDVRVVEVDDAMDLGGKDLSADISNKRKHDEEDDKEEEQETNKKKGKKKKKKKKASLDGPPTPEPEEKPVKLSKSEKKKRKKARTSNADEEDVITISVADQKRAQEKTEDDQASVEEQIGRAHV